jgi:putative flippase GtrA
MNAKSARVKQVTTFGLVSVATTLLDFGLFNVLIAADVLPVVSANSIGYGAGIAASYLLNKYLTFQGGGRDRRSQEFALFVAINIVGLLLNNLAVVLAESAISDSALVLNAAKLAAGVATWVVKFVAFERWVYPVREPTAGVEGGEPPAF